MMKKFIVLYTCIFSIYTYAEDWNIKKNESQKKFLESSKQKKIEKLILAENSQLEIKGKDTRGILISGSPFKTKAEIGGNARLNLEIENDDLDAVGIAFEGNKTFTVSKNGNLNIKSHYNKKLNNGDIFTQLMAGKMGISINKKFSTEGNVTIESSGTGIGFSRKTSKNQGIIEFKGGSKSLIKGGFAGIFGRYNNVIFEKGSNTTLIGGAYGLMVNKGTFKNGSKVTLIGGYGNGKFEVKDKDQLIFDSGSEINIFANDGALYGLNIKGKTKLVAKARNIIKQIDTYKVPGGGPLETFTFEKGSILDGSIDRSWNAKFILEEGAKIFAPEYIQTNLELNGDLYIGPRSAYEGKMKTYLETVKEYDSDAVAGATAIFFGKQAERAKKNEFSYAETYNDYNPNNYYELEYNINSHGHKSELKLNNGSKLHLRIGDVKFGKTNDKIKFSKDTIIKGEGTELILHVNGSSKIKKNSKFILIEEEGKQIDNKKGYYLKNFPITLNDINIGPLIYKRKDEIIDGKYLISLQDSGLLTSEAKKSLATNRAYLEHSQDLSQKLSSKIFEDYNAKIKNNLWFLFTENNFKDKENLTRIKENSKYVGYDYTTDSNLSLGFFLGESNGKYKDTSQGIYFKKNLEPFYIGGIFKYASSKYLETKFHSKDVSFVTGYNKNITEKIYLDINLKLTNIYIPTYEYTENNLSIKNKKFNYLSSSYSNKVVYKSDMGNFSFIFNLEKELKRKQKVVWNDNISENIKYNSFNKNIGLGYEYTYNNHNFDIKFLKKFSKYYKYNTNLTIGYSYKF